MKVLSPEIVIVALGQGFHCLEASLAAGATGESVAACRGLSPWQVIERIASELGRAALFPRSLQQAEEARRKCGGAAVGLTHSRGVAGVMYGAGVAPRAYQKIRTH